MKRLALGVVVVAACLGACNSGFSEDEIKNIQDSIRIHYGKKQGVEVLDVQMIKAATSNQLTGFVKLRVGLPFGLHKDITNDCSATKGDGKSLWTCGKD